MAKFRINDVELELNLLDAGEVDKYEELNKKVLDTVNDPDLKKEKSSDAIRAMCRAIDRLFDGLFGDGIAVKLFGDNGNLMTRLEGYDLLVTKARTNTVDTLSNMKNKYSRERLGNRKQRRSKGKYHG